MGIYLLLFNPKTKLLLCLPFAKSKMVFVPVLLLDLIQKPIVIPLIPKNIELIVKNCRIRNPRRPHIWHHGNRKRILQQLGYQPPQHPTTIMINRRVRVDLNQPQLGISINHEI